MRNRSGTIWKVPFSLAKKGIGNFAEYGLGNRTPSQESGLKWRRMTLWSRLFLACARVGEREVDALINLEGNSWDLLSRKSFRYLIVRAGYSEYSMGYAVASRNISYRVVVPTFPRLETILHRCPWCVTPMSEVSTLRCMGCVDAGDVPIPVDDWGVNNLVGWVRWGRGDEVNLWWYRSCDCIRCCWSLLLKRKISKNSRHRGRPERPPRKVASRSLWNKTRRRTHKVPQQSFSGRIFAVRRNSKEARKNTSQETGRDERLIRTFG